MGKKATSLGKWKTSGNIKNMVKNTHQKRRDTLVKTIEKKYGVDLRYRSDAELHSALKKDGLPSLSKLLKIVHKKSV